MGFQAGEVLLGGGRTRPRCSSASGRPESLGDTHPPGGKEIEGLVNLKSSDYY